METTYIKGRLIRVERRHTYGTIDVDSWRDGGWWMPASCEKKVREMVKEYGIAPPEMGERYFEVNRVPLAILDEVAGKLAEILSRYRCDHAVLLDWKRA